MIVLWKGGKKSFHVQKRKKIIIFFYFELPKQGVTKRCPSWLTNIALVYEPKCGGKGVAGP
jgi:hypothetical protein